MTWLLLDGLDKTGKSTVAQLYKAKGYEVVHMTAPDKKYKEPGYAGPSYLDDVLEMYMKYDSRDAIFDRTIYGETVWPHVYNRTSLLTEEDIEILQEFESKNSAQRILMIDSDTKAHWKRCVDNKEPLNNNQFRLASTLFNKLAHKYNFIPRELKDYKDASEKENSNADSILSKQEETLNVGKNKTADALSTISIVTLLQTTEESELDKLERANAIRDVLTKSLVKQKGGKAYELLEKDIRVFLKDQLSNIFKESSPRVSLTVEEITVLKIFCQRLKEKEGKK